MHIRGMTSLSALALASILVLAPLVPAGASADPTDDPSTSATPDPVDSDDPGDDTTPAPTQTVEPGPEPTMADFANVSFATVIVYDIDKTSIRVQTSWPIPVAFGAATARKGVLPVGHLQINRGTGWVETGVSIPQETERGAFTGTIPPLSTSPTAKAETVRYRLVVDDSIAPRIDGDVSGEVTVFYDNPRLYAGLKKRVYKAVARYCPFAVVEVTKLSGRLTTTKTGTWLISVDPKLAKVSSTALASRAMFACAFILGYRTYGGTGNGFGALSEEAESLFGSWAETHLFDCMMVKAVPKAKLLFGGTCTAKQKRYANRVLHGKRLH